MPLVPRALHQLPAFSAETVQIVRRSCAQLPEDQLELTREFYRQLFEMAPQARAMFPPDMNEQNERLLGAILAAVRHLDRPELVEGHLRRWGIQHRRMHEVNDELYPYVAHALVRALHKIFGYLETSVASAWMAVYEWMAAVMIDGANTADAIDRNPGRLVPQAPFGAGHGPDTNPQQRLYPTNYPSNLPSNVVPFRRPSDVA
jgi:hemoglobin-like flavoprotein